MAKTQKKTHQTKPKISCFLIPACCYGFSEEVSEQNSVKTIRSDGKKNTGWFFLPRFRMKKSTGTKTVPVESTLSEKSDPKHKVPASRSKPDKLTSKLPQAPVHNHEPPSQIPVPAPVPSNQKPKAKERPQETTYGQARNILLERREHLDHSDISKEDTCRKRLSFHRRKEAIRTGSSQPGSPENNHKPATRLAAISPTFSLPVSVSANSRAMPKKPNRHRENESSAEKLDPVVGLSIIMITLMIMLVWGRLCAVICTSAWFYFVPRLSNASKSRETVGKDPNNSHDQDYDSEEHKKKVVMEGFLERNNHRSTL
ncbi:uncharacterized protein LOC121254001 [Juglans microcarpa x Juglans regia]|uniref:uncharacterized protein LOC121254001 n=1 Tax=Juglans microcarpa x Juglans regia TaxID=2249226 RepID=UPI001B7E808A|nr:uncharacterized protein LOC121254001 [Juglans microcarpa x Juglans regia]